MGAPANLVLENVQSCLATTAMPDNRGPGSARTGWRCISSPLSKSVVASCPVGSAGNLVKRGWRTTVSGPASNQGDSTFTLNGESRKERSHLFHITMAFLLTLM